MPEEIEDYVALLSDHQTAELGGRTFHTGKINGVSTVIVFSRWGKVAATTTVTTLILHFKISELIFTGVAGAIDSRLKIGDVVIGKRFVQHDMDARPLMKQFEIPLLGVCFFESSEALRNRAQTKMSEVLSEFPVRKNFEKMNHEIFHLHRPEIYIGDVASGDKFFSSNTDKRHLLSILPTILCVEMEGAAVAQVCFEYKVPFTVIRVISDQADDHAEINFSAFVKQVASKYFISFIEKYFNS